MIFRMIWNAFGGASHSGSSKGGNPRFSYSRTIAVLSSCNTMSRIW